MFGFYCIGEYGFVGSGRNKGRVELRGVDAGRFDIGVDEGLRGGERGVIRGRINICWWLVGD